jgi:hypothetical protein
MELGVIVALVAAVAASIVWRVGSRRGEHLGRSLDELRTALGRQAHAMAELARELDAASKTSEIAFATIHAELEADAKRTLEARDLSAAVVHSANELLDQYERRLEELPNDPPDNSQSEPHPVVFIAGKSGGRPEFRLGSLISDSQAIAKSLRASLLSPVADISESIVLIARQTLRDSLEWTTFSGFMKSGKLIWDESDPGCEWVSRRQSHGRNLLHSDNFFARAR